MTRPPSVYDYLDYRRFLSDLMSFKKKQGGKKYSYRFLARACGFASPNFIKLVIEGQRNLTNESLAKIALGFGLSPTEREFFENLVFMNQSETHAEKDYYYQKMMAAKAYTKIHKIHKACYEYFSKWYYPAIREMAVFNDGGYSAAEIADRLTPRITPKEAEKALTLLTELGLIAKDAQGKWRQVDNTITTGPEVQSLTIANFHKEMLKLAAESIDRFSSAERDITGLTISINSQKISLIKELIAGLRKELLTLACQDELADQVIQINFQVFPLSKPVKREGTHAT